MQGLLSTTPNCLFFRVKNKELIVKKDNQGKHCLKDWQKGDRELLIYPYRSGSPFYLEPIKIEHINKEIDCCEKWGLSPQYYKNLKIYTWQEISN